MIFLTVGTDHHQFHRLLKKMDALAADEILQHELVVQYGLNRFIPKAASQLHDFLSFDKMIEYIKKAEIIITHASSTAMLAITNGKIPVVVPRDKKFNEIIDDHQLEFARKLENELPMIVVYDVEKIGDVLKNYSQLSDAICKRASLSSDSKNQAVLELDRLVHKWFPN
ncbi:glycosyltransferase [Desulfobacter sp. UBA2225]|uniref:glycosyltransferase n=1 Tax=Desulfobacter sp. UBA2225 TaxID=1961413 RepID=UPI00257B5478|nr:glycosyltransferase [Desulfobacter sp. UBA2225]